MKNLKTAFLVTAFLVVALVFFGAKSIYMAEDEAPAPSQPNIIFILIDDMGLGDLSSYGGTVEPTPNIDRLAAEGIRFTDFNVVSPICSPSRAGFTTGMLPARWQITTFLQKRAGNHKAEQADYLDPEAPSIARTLKSVGYVTGHFGKWHMGGGRDVDNAPKLSAYGFDEAVSTWESPQPDPAITATDWIWSPKDKVKRWDRTAYFVDKTLDFMKRHKHQPMYIQLWPDDVHTPWVPEEKPDDVSMRKSAENLRPVIRTLDQQIGRLVAGLQELGLAEKTLIIFSSDNGALPTFDGQRSLGLRGSKLSLYQGGVRVPFIAYWPGRVPAGETQSAFFTAVDLFPSLAALAGAPLPDKHVLDGQNLSAALLGKDASHQGPVFWEYGRNNSVFKYPQAPDRSPNLAVREGNWKLLVNDDGTGAELYNLADDPNETLNLSKEKPGITQRLLNQVLQWRQSLP